MKQSTATSSPDGDPAVKRPWMPPTVQELPKLTDLTLQSPEGGWVGGGGSTGGGGGSVF